MEDLSADDVDYETPDGSTFSLRAIWSADSNPPVFQYTSISARVDGRFYTGRLTESPNEADDGDVLSALEPVPPGCIHPRYQEGFQLFPFESDDLNFSDHFMKSPSYTYEDCQPGCTFVADCFLNEASMYELLSNGNDHPNFARYSGCVVKDGYITHIALERFDSSLREYAIRLQLSKEQRTGLLEGLEDAIKHLHSLGFAHNDVNVDNVCVLEDSAQGPMAVLVDLDGCLSFGKKLLKGVDVEAEDGQSSMSRASNDWHGLDLIRQFLSED